MPLSNIFDCGCFCKCSCRLFNRIRLVLFLVLVLWVYGIYFETLFDIYIYYLVLGQSKKNVKKYFVK